MFEPRHWLRIRKAILVIVLGIVAHCAWVEYLSGPITVFARHSVSSAGTGEFGGDLTFLRQHWTRPGKDESNHYIDLWSSGSLPVLARVNGLTNNRALFVDSHGKARHGSTYAFYPHESLLLPHRPTPYFSARDLALLLGPTEAAEIHNIIIAGCNEEKRFRSQELRRYFVNATNVTYMTPGQLAFKPMFYQAIVLPSSEIKPLYGKLRRAADGRLEAATSDTATRGARPLGTYIADLYLPGARNPFRTRKAGRELLEPAAPMLRADAAEFSDQP